MKQIYCLFDKKVGFYNNELILLDNDVSAERWLYCFFQSAKDATPNSAFATYPDDFDMYCVGTFDQTDCITAVYDKPRFVANVGSLVYKEV